MVEFWEGASALDRTIFERVFEERGLTGARLTVI
jgi:hypothetical protein